MCEETATLLSLSEQDVWAMEIEDALRALYLFAKHEECKKSNSVAYQALKQKVLP